METNYEIVWVKNNFGGYNALVGIIKIGSYIFNGVDSNNGIYKVTSLVPQTTQVLFKVFTEEEARKLITFEFDLFLTKLSL